MTKRREERGAVAIVMAASCLVLVMIAAFAVDLGMQRVARRDMQSLADVVALDLARDLDNRLTTDYSVADLQSRANASRARNGDTLGETPNLLPELGMVNASDGTFRPAVATDRPNAIRVTATTEVGFAFGVARSGGASRSAVASRSEPMVCFSLGTKTLSLDTSGSALGPVLDQILRINLGAVGYEGIVDLKEVSIPLADLLVELNVGSVDELASTNVGLADFVVAAADVARANGDTATAAVLQGIRLGVPGVDIPLADILALQTGSDLAGLTTDVNLLDLLTAAVVAANGDHALAASIPGLTSLTVIEPPQIACGGRGAVARSAQIRINVKPTLLDTVGLGLLGGNTDLNIEIGRGSATVDADLSCAPEQVTLRVTTGAVSVLPPASGAYGQVNLALTVNKFLSFLGPLDLLGIVSGLVRGLGLGQVTLDVLVAGSVASTTETKTVTFPAPPGMPPVLVVPNSGIGSTLHLTGVGVRLTPGANGTLVALLGALLNPVLAGLLGGLVQPVLNTVLDPVLTSVLTPILNFLGVKLGVAEVKMLGRPVCNGVRLVG